MKSAHAAIAAAALLAACEGSGDQTGGGGAPPEVVAPAAASAPLALPISLNEVMVALVDFAADGVWRPGASETPLTERQWLYVEQDATNVVASATLITFPGTGVNDAEWVTQEDWRNWSREMQAAALQARAAAKARDQAALKVAGDALVETCMACHRQYKPGLPAMGVTRFPIYPKRTDEP